MKVRRYIEQEDLSDIVINYNDNNNYTNIVKYCEKIQSIIDLISILEAHKIFLIPIEVNNEFLRINGIVRDDSIEVTVVYNKKYFENIDFSNILDVIKLLNTIVESYLVELKRINFQNTLIVLFEKSDNKYDKLIMDKLKKEFT